jgi:hypothetical protein
MKTLQEGLWTIIKNGIKYGQIKPETDADHYSSLFIATLEGGIMMSKLRGSNKDMETVLKHLYKIIDDISL